MADETGEQDSAAVAQADSVQAEPKSFVGADGMFEEGWIDGLVPEDLRHVGDYKTITNVAQLATEFGHAKTLIGRQGKGIMPLPADAGPTEKAAYYTALGRPKTPDDYKIVAPEGEDAYEPDALTEPLRVMHDLGLSQAQAQGLVAFDAKRVKDAGVQREAADKAVYDEGLKTLKVEWGDAFDQKMHQAKSVIEQCVPEDQREGVLERWGNDLDLTRALSTMGELLLEDTLADAGGAGAQASTPDEMERQAKELMETPGYIEARLPEATMARIQREIHALHEKAREARTRA